MKIQISVEIETDILNLSELAKLNEAMHNLSEVAPVNDQIYDVTMAVSTLYSIRRQPTCQYYQAYTGTNGAIVKVFAEDPLTAKDEIEHQLNRAGRYDLLKAWVNDGCKIRLVD